MSLKEKEDILNWHLEISAVFTDASEIHMGTSVWKIL